MTPRCLALLVGLTILVRDGDAISTASLENAMLRSQAQEILPPSASEKASEKDGHMLATVAASGKIDESPSSSKWKQWAARLREGHPTTVAHDQPANFITAASSGKPQVPKIIWAFWQESSWLEKVGMALHGFGLQSLAGAVMRHAYTYYYQYGEKEIKLDPFLELCVLTWKKLNPDYEIRLLNFRSMWDWVNRSDLPERFEDFEVLAHRSDAVRLAVLNKYGGTWMDVSILLLKPLSHLLGPDRTRRPFFILNGRKRFVENWFLSAPPNDPLLTAVTKCVHEVYSHLPDRTGTEETSVFSAQQTQALCDLQIDCSYKGNGLGYLSTHACFYKVLDESKSLAEFFDTQADLHEAHDNAASQLMSTFDTPDACPGKHTEESPACGSARTWAGNFVCRVCPDMVDEFMDQNQSLLKFSGDSREFVIEFDKNQLVYANSTLTEVLKRTGVLDKEGQESIGHSPSMLMGIFAPPQSIIQKD